MREKKKILVSACLLGISCRYDGGDNRCEKLEAWMTEAELIPFCPEIYGGLPTPRTPSEIRDGCVVTKDGRDVTDAFEKGAQEARKLAKRLGCQMAVLKERSPSCGSHEIYDGSFTGMRIPGMGVTARLLAESGIEILSEEELVQNALEQERRGK